MGKFIGTALGLLTALSCGSQIVAPEIRTEPMRQPHGNFSNNIARPLRYWPVSGDFVVTNGLEFFNRPLYCVNSGFRIDGGDRPEFSLYLPGRGGNLRLGLKTRLGTKWLNDAAQIITRYRAGSLIYAIHDTLLGDTELDLTVLPLNQTKGLVLQAVLQANGTARAKSPVDLIFAFGGANGAAGSRGGDIGCERQPVTEFFQLHPEECRNGMFTIDKNTFTLRQNKIHIAGVAPADAKLFLANVANWNIPEALPAAAGGDTELTMLAGEASLTPDQPDYIALQLIGNEYFTKTYQVGDLPQVFAAAEAHRRAVAERVTVATPDPFINASVPALCVAADAVWDDKLQCFMHGAVAWRTRLLGWRGPYLGDALGWHERTAAHFAGFARQQNTSPIPQTIPPADESFNLARSEAAIHSNGDMSKNHYDMNLVAVDAFFRHLLWTGDTNYARQMWPVIERHLAWERRLFRREFGPDRLPLYEAYAAIWASDDLDYNGGGTTHASAYNFFANKMAGRVARALGQDPAPYEKEADQILRGMNQYLWLEKDGNFAESKDLLGLQLVHPNAGLWTFYHTIDSEVPTSAQAWRMTRWLDNHIAHIPITGAHIPEENLFTVPETSWMPYQWSLNNVVMAEAAHTALGYWEANRPEDAFRLFKGELLDSMFLGLCPGNLGCLTTHDMARGEAQRDFADAMGVNSRALVEGLFGVKPDVLAGTLKIVPGFPGVWNFAEMHHPDFDFAFRRTCSASGNTDNYSIRSRFPTPMQLDLQIPALGTSARISVNGKHAAGHIEADIYGTPRMEIHSRTAGSFEIFVNWRGHQPSASLPASDPNPAKPVPEKTRTFDWSKPVPDNAVLESVDLTPFFNDPVTRIFRNDYRSPRSPFASLATPVHGVGGWCEPNASFDVNDSGLRKVAAENSGRIVLPNGISFATPSETGVKNILFTSQWDNYPRDATVPLTGKSSHAFLLLAGSTGPLQSQFDNGEIVVRYADGSMARLALRNPSNWWPIDQDYYTDDFAFRREGPIPPRVNLATGHVTMPAANNIAGGAEKIPGGAATVLEMPLNAGKPLKSLTVRSLANEIVIGLMAVTLQR
jgi:hypothetical protein